MRGGWVYLLANRYRGTIYTAVTANLAARVYIKKWRRDWKIELIERDNPDWIDRYDQLIGL